MTKATASRRTMSSHVQTSASGGDVTSDVIRAVKTRATAGKLQPMSGQATTGPDAHTALAGRLVRTIRCSTATLNWQKSGTSTSTIVPLIKSPRSLTSLAIGPAQEGGTTNGGQPLGLDKGLAVHSAPTGGCPRRTLLRRSVPIWSGSGIPRRMDAGRRNRRSGVPIRWSGGDAPKGMTTCGRQAQMREQGLGRAAVRSAPTKGCP